MKKITALIMALIMCISLSACGSSTDGTKDSETKDDDKKVTTIPKSEDPIKDLLATKFYYNNKAFTLPTTVSEGKVFFTTWKNFRIDEHKKEGFDFSEAETLSSNYGVTYEVYEYDSNGEAKGWPLILTHRTILIKT